MIKKLWGTCLLLVVVMLIMEFVSLKANAKEREIYPNAGIITELDYENDIVYFTDFSGEVWSFYGIEDLLEGDIVAVIMQDKGKPNYIWDDAVIDIRYVGYAY